ncbi:Dedicator of cytokinesis protein 9 [Lamellibrachia satsuma]|nr:Dedicator of cytokinesis protein 9 [Lamellibrachia satsuma]
MCGQLCYEILRCCNLRLTSTRREACALLYLLMRSNFEFSKRKNFTRVHLQMIISVSQLISAVVGLSNSRFSESLSVINSYANNDKAIQKTSFPMEVKDLTKRIRTVLMATAAMKEHQNDPEVLIDLQYSLAKSYASTPELRKTWLESMARIHSKNGNYSEAAHSYLHIVIAHFQAAHCYLHIVIAHFLAAHCYLHIVIAHFQAAHCYLHIVIAHFQAAHCYLHIVIAHFQAAHCFLHIVIAHFQAAHCYLHIVIAHFLAAHCYLHIVIAHFQATHIYLHIVIAHFQETHCYLHIVIAHFQAAHCYLHIVIDHFQAAHCYLHIVIAHFQAAHCDLHIVIAHFQAAQCYLHIVIVHFQAAHCYLHIVIAHFLAAHCYLHIVIAHFQAAHCYLHIVIAHFLAAQCYLHIVIDHFQAAHCYLHIMIAHVLAAHCYLHIVIVHFQAAHCYLHIVIAHFQAAHCYLHIVIAHFLAAQCYLHIVIDHFQAAHCYLHIVIAHVLAAHCYLHIVIVHFQAAHCYLHIVIDHFQAAHCYLHIVIAHFQAAHCYLHIVIVHFQAAHCYLHIAALVAEYLRRRGDFPQGCSAFVSLSPNVKREESAMQDDCGMQDVHYTKDHLTELLEQCAELMEKAERYELLGRLYRLIVPIYELNRDFKKLAHAYDLLHRAYSKVVEVMQSGRRLLGQYFRVAFFGAVFEEDDRKEYIYKEPKITGLTEICERLRDLYTSKFGKGSVQLIMDSAQVNADDLDQKFAYIQVTHVTPYFDKAELEQRRTDFECSNNLKQFMYETPFTRDGRARGQIGEQHKRRVVLTTDHSFPYIKKRLLVYYRKQDELSPIEVAIDEMRKRVTELHEVVSQPQTDVKKLQLKLQGCISVQVNAGPVAYADVFLEEENVRKFRPDKVTALKDIFREFVNVCKTALDLNGRVINSDQLEYQESLDINFREMTERLAEIFGEPLLAPDEDTVSMTGHRGSMSVFNVISATSSASAI